MRTRLDRIRWPGDRLNCGDSGIPIVRLDLVDILSDGGGVALEFFVGERRGGTSASVLAVTKLFCLRRQTRSSALSHNTYNFFLGGQ
jgi:hypothetical protein